MASSTQGAALSPIQPSATNLIIGYVAICSVCKAIAAFSTNFTGDEAYTVVIARTFALSYFDHPPLHQWIVHSFAAFFGEGSFLRAPFLLMSLLINLPLFGLSNRLFGWAAALWTLFTFNTVSYFLIWPDGLIIPDIPLFLLLASAIWALAEILFGPPRDGNTSTALWIAVGIAFGFSGLSKYSALFTVIGLMGFLVFSPHHRHWLLRPQPYLGATIALIILVPVFVWNRQNHFVSFAFQSGRVAAGLTLDKSSLTAFGSTLFAQVGSLSLFVVVPLLMALASAARSRNPSSAERFLLWLVIVPISIFTLMPFFGKLAIPHWYNSGWLFALPLLGKWLSAKSETWLRVWGVVCAAYSAVIFVGYFVIVSLGPFWPSSIAGFKLRDPTEWDHSWIDLRKAVNWPASTSPSSTFIVVNRWRVGGKVGVEFGPEVSICDFSGDPRGFAFVCDPKNFLGRDALIVIPTNDAEYYLPSIGKYFSSFDASQEIVINRGTGRERTLTLTLAHKLIRGYPLPYGVGPQ